MQCLVNKKRIKFVVIAFMSVLFVTPFLVHAGVADLVTDIMAHLGLALVNFFGTLLLALIDILIRVASFNTFIDSEAVSIGWVVVRDITNMFFVVVLLIIAFATILKIESYAYQRMLVKLILAVIWVNFSKMITGLFIDIGQVIMMTFVNAFRDIAAGNLTYGLGLEDMLKLREAGGRSYVPTRDSGAAVGNIDNWDVLGGVILGLIFLIVAGAVILIMIVFLVVRIIYLWILAIFSPVVFILPLVPGGQKYSGMWWQNLSKYIVLGPVLAFFLWLTFTITAKSGDSTRRAVIMLESETAGGEAVDKTWFASEISGTQKMLNFMVTTALLVMAMGFAQEVGGIAGKFAGQVQGKLGQWGKKAALGAVKLKPLTRLGNLALRKTPKLRDSLVGKWAQDIHNNRESKKTNKRIALMRKMGMGDESFKKIAEKHPEERKGLKRLLGAVISNRTIKAANKQASYIRKTKQLNAKYNHASSGVREAAWAKTSLGTFTDASDTLTDTGGGVIKDLTSDSLDSFTKHINNEIGCGDPQRQGKAIALREELLDGIAAMYKKDGGVIKNKAVSDWVASSGGGLKMDESQMGFDMKTRSGKVNFMRDITAVDHKKQQDTHAMIKEHGMDFFNSDEYNRNKDQYYSREQYAEEEGLIRSREGGNTGGMSVNAFARGQADHATVDFTHLQGIEGLEELEGKAGVHMADLSDEQRTAVAGQMSKLISEKMDLIKDNYAVGEEMTGGDKHQMANYKQALQKFNDPNQFSKIALYNTDRKGVGARRLITHEMRHDALEEMDGGGAIRNAVWDAHSDDEKRQIIQQMKDKQGDQSMSESEAMEEYFAEGLANITAWGDKSDSAVKMDPKYLNMFGDKIQELVEKGTVSGGGALLQSDIQIAQTKAALAEAESERDGWLARLKVGDVVGLDQKKATQGSTFETDTADAAIVKVKNLRADLDRLQFGKSQPGAMTDAKVMDINQQIAAKQAQLAKAKGSRDALFGQLGVGSTQELDQQEKYRHTPSLKSGLARGADTEANKLAKELAGLEAKKAQQVAKYQAGQNKQWEKQNAAKLVEQNKQNAIKLAEQQRVAKYSAPLAATTKVIGQKQATLAAAKNKQQQFFSELGVANMDELQRKAKLSGHGKSLKMKMALDMAGEVARAEKELKKLEAQQVKYQQKLNPKIAEPKSVVQTVKVEKPQASVVQTVAAGQQPAKPPVAAPATQAPAQAPATAPSASTQPPVQPKSPTQTQTGAAEAGSIGNHGEAILNELKDIRSILEKHPDGRATIKEINNIRTGAAQVVAGGGHADYKVLKSLANLGASLSKRIVATQFGTTQLGKRLAGVSKAVAAMGSAPAGSEHDSITISAALKNEGLNVQDVKEIISSLPKN